MPVDTHLETEHQIQGITLSRTDQPRAETLQQSPTVTVLQNDQTSTLSVQLGVMTTRNANCVQEDEICRQDGQLENGTWGENDAHYPRESGYP